MQDLTNCGDQRVESQLGSFAGRCTRIDRSIRYSEISRARRETRERNLGLTLR